MTGPPDRPTGAPNDIIDRLRSQSPGMLRELSTYAVDLADYKAAEHDRDQDADEDLEERDDLHAPEEYDDVDVSNAPAASAYITEKTIDDNVYLYWQWREGDTVKSSYIRPKNPKQEPKSK